MYHVQERVEVYTGFWCGNMRGRDHSEEPGTDGRIILRWIFREWDVRAWSVSVGLKIGIGGRHL